MHIFDGTFEKVMSVICHWWMLVIGGDEKGKCELIPHAPKCHIFLNTMYKFALTSEEHYAFVVQCSPLLI